jgi:hypothetical protein
LNSGEENLPLTTRTVVEKAEINDLCAQMDIEKQSETKPVRAR